MKTVELPQHLEALNRANAVRSEQAKVYRLVKARSLKEGLVYVAGLLESGAVENCRLDRLLGAITRFSYVRRSEALDAAWISPASLVRKVSELTPRQRLALGTVLRGMAR